MDMDDPTDENGYCPVCGPRHFFLSGEWFHQQHLEEAKQRHPSSTTRSEIPKENHD